MTPKRAVLLVGSPKGLDRGTSSHLGGTLLGSLRERGFETDKIHIHAALRSSSELQSALGTAARADLVILSAPLYVDSFPAPVIAFLEHLAEQTAQLRASGSAGSAVRFIVLIQCGFPEKRQNALALAIAKRFAKEVGWDWLGGLALGGVDTYGKTAGDALGLVAAAIADGRPVPEIKPKKTMPMWLYGFGGNFMWRSAARKSGVSRRLRDRPYAH